MPPPVSTHLDSVLSGHFAPTAAEIDDALTSAYAERLALANERRAIEREILALAIRAEEPEAARELRRLWLRQRTIKRENELLQRQISAVVERFRT